MSKKEMATNEMQSSDLRESDESCDGIDDEAFKERLVRKIAKLVKDKIKICTLWPQLDQQTGYNSKQLWILMRRRTEDKLMCLLLANDLVKDVDEKMRITAVDWLLFDLLLAHQKINVTNCETLPQCLINLYELVVKHGAETLVGDELAEAWIRITLEYNDGDRQCSPMLLQRRWNQLKLMSRRQVYKPVENLNSNKLNLLHAIAIRYQKIITSPHPKWHFLIRKRCVILSEEFVEILKRDEKWKDIEACEGWYLKKGKENSNYNKKAGNADIGGNPDIITINMTTDSDSGNNDMLCKKGNNRNNTDKSKVVLKLDPTKKNIIKEKSKIPVNIPKEKPRPIRYCNNEPISLDSDDETDTVLRE